MIAVEKVTEEKRKALARTLLHLQIIRLHVREVELLNQQFDLGLDVPRESKIADLQDLCAVKARASQ